VTATRDATLVDSVRELLASFAPGRAVCTELGAALVCRYRGPSVEQARHAFAAVHGFLRERCFDARALTPRILLT
jgi:urease accessory protein UreH